MNKENLIARVSDALYENRGVIFVGSGVSVPSTQIDWLKLLKSLADDIGVTIGMEHDDLTLIAQYIVNEYTGNRGPLINAISKALNNNFPLNNYHKAISITKVSTIWTTNYDNLLERAFSDLLVDVKVNDDAISRNIVNSNIEILKIHGCISRSRHSEIIITQEDYEDFLDNKPATSQRLCNDLLKKSFLFIGYSYREGRPTIESTIESVKTARIAAHIIDIHNLDDTAMDMEIVENRVKSNTCVFGKNTKYCDRCMKYCPLMIQ